MWQIFRNAGWLRFITHIPSGWYAIIAITHAVHLAKFPILRHEPYNPVTIPAEQTAAAAGFICFAWNFIMWLGVWMFEEGNTALAMGVVDLLITGMLFTGVILQGRYIPHSYSACNDVLHFGGVPPDTPSLFQVVNATASVGDLRNQCKSYALEWGFGISVVILYTIITAWRLIFFKPEHTDFRKVCLVVAAVVFLPGTLIVGACLYFSVFPRIMACAHYLRRIRQLWKIRNETGDQSRLYLEKCAEQYTVEKVSNASLKRLDIKPGNHKPWLPFDVMVLLSQHLHQTDLVSLSMTCKRIRAALGPINETNIRLTNRFSKYTCSSGNRQQCWGCGIQTCQECHAWGRDMKTDLEWHVSACRASCHACARANYFHTYQIRHAPKSCMGHTDRLPRFWSTYYPFDDFLDPQKTCYVCRGCQKKSVQDILRQRSLQDKWALQQLVRQPTTCHLCHNKLSDRGPQFWICWCGRECLDHSHCRWKRNENSSASKTPLKMITV